MVDQVMSGRWCGSDGGSGDEWEVCGSDGGSGDEWEVVW